MTAVTDAIIKSGTKLTVAGHNAIVVKILRDGVLMKIGEPGKERQVTVDFSQMENAAREAEQREKSGEKR